MFAPLAEAKSLRFDLVRENNTTQIPYLDETKLKQILINLLSNALGHTEQGEISARID